MADLIELKNHLLTLKVFFPKFAAFLSKLGLAEFMPIKSIRYIEDLINQMIKMRRNNPNKTVYIKMINFLVIYFIVM